MINDAHSRLLTYDSVPSWTATITILRPPFFFDNILLTKCAIILSVVIPADTRIGEYWTTRAHDTLAVPITTWPISIIRAHAKNVQYHVMSRVTNREKKYLLFVGEQAWYPSYEYTRRFETVGTLPDASGNENRSGARWWQVKNGQSIRFNMQAHHIAHNCDSEIMGLDLHTAAIHLACM